MSPVWGAAGIVVYGLLLAGLALGTRLRTRLFPLSALGLLALAVLGGLSLHLPASTLVLPMGLPEFPMRWRLDALAGFFLLLLGGSGFGITLHAWGYFRTLDGPAAARLGFWYQLFLTGMVLVVLADDAYAFMVAWELMALSSYFLVTTDHKIPAIRQAGFLYLLMAHAGAVALLLMFGVLQGGTGDYSFVSMRLATLSPTAASLVFCLALLGFGAKAGLVPLHIWLPEAHPAAPSPVSALMSGIMLKLALYGLLRVTFDLLSVRLGWWGVLALSLGLATALYGVIFAAVQADMKRLLAWSSIENIGILIAAFGLTLIFHADGKPALAALTLTALLYHALNHACFKGLLFIGTGSVLHATGERRMGRLGGLIRTMPQTAWLTLIGVLAIMGLPPLNGFVSEWLLLQAFLLTPSLTQPYLNTLIPVAAAGVTLAAALAAYVMVKFYGVIFLGQPREAALAHAHEASRRERLGMFWLAGGCVVLGLWPGGVLWGLAPVVQTLVGQTLPADQTLFLVPVAAERARYAPLLFLVTIATVLALVVLVSRWVYRGRVRRSAPWDCGYPKQDARMQDTAEGFGQPIRLIFAPFMRIEREIPGPFDPQPYYRGDSRDRLWLLLYQPLIHSVTWLAAQAGRLQQGQIQTYLIYSFLTLIGLLVVVT